MSEVHQPVADSPPTTPPWGWITSGIAIAAIVIVSAILWRTRVDVPVTPPASPVRITALTTTRDSSLPALSHDGRFVEREQRQGRRVGPGHLDPCRRGHT
jgi:hypothetical protein